MKETTESIEVKPNDHHGEDIPGFLKPDIVLVGVTWLCFLILLFVLSKFAWKPILAVIDEREGHIKKSVEDADKIKNEMENLAQTQKTMLEEAESTAKTIIDDSRKAAKEAAKHITEEARKESQIILENAQRDMKEEIKEAQATLKVESAKIAVELASKIIEENLDDAKNKKLVSEYIKEL